MVEGYGGRRSDRQDDSTMTAMAQHSVRARIRGIEALLDGEKTGGVLDWKVDKEMACK
jgi:hypothetical protein